jgi:hypothetical protein
MQLGTRMHKQFSKYPPSLRTTIEKSGKIPRGTPTLLLLRLSILILSETRPHTARVPLTTALPQPSSPQTPLATIDRNVSSLGSGPAYTPAKRQPKVKVRPTSDALKAAAKRLNATNSKAVTQTTRFGLGRKGIRRSTRSRS